MKNVDKNRGRDKVAISLMLCFCAIALTSVFTIKSNIEKISEDQEEALTSDQIRVEKNFSNEKDKPDSAKKSKETAAPSSIVDSANTSKSKGAAALDLINPISSKGSVLKDYSMDTVIYNVTLDQYMTHSGVDIEAPTDTKVRAAAAGTVTNVGKDDGYGITIEINHGNGYVTRYSNLTTGTLVEKGDSVKQGKVIGGVGDSGLYECAETDHLHFELLRNGKYLNPSKYIAF